METEGINFERKNDSSSSPGGNKTIDNKPRVEVEKIDSEIETLKGKFVFSFENNTGDEVNEEKTETLNEEEAEAMKSYIRFEDFVLSLLKNVK